MPKPVLMLLDLRFPIACSDLGADDLENEFIIRNLHLHKACLFLQHTCLSFCMFNYSRLIKLMTSDSGEDRWKCSGRSRHKRTRWWSICCGVGYRPMHFETHFLLLQWYCYKQFLFFSIWICIDWFLRKFLWMMFLKLTSLWGPLNLQDCFLWTNQ